MTAGWEDLFRSLFEQRGYRMRSCVFDPLHGWTVLYEPLAGGKAREFEVQTTTAVQRRIKRLPKLSP